MSLNRRIYKENVAHWHKGVLCSCARNDITKFVGKWMELEKKINLSEVTQTKKAKYGIFIYVWILAVNLMTPKLPSWEAQRVGI